jgi:hypothetical protein
MKKSISILVLFALVAAGVFAQGFSMAFGGGGLFDLSTGNGYKMGYTDYSMSSSAQNMSFGGFLFFDATFFELDVNFTYGLLKTTTEVSIGSVSVSTKGDGQVLSLGFSGLFKYPLDLGALNLFPLIGADYNMVLSGKSKIGDTWESWKDGEGDDKSTVAGNSQLGILGGVGFDFPFSDTLFLRFEGLFHYRLASANETTAKNAYNLLAAIDPDFSYDIKNGLGARAKLGIGFKL